MAWFESVKNGTRAHVDKLGVRKSKTFKLRGDAKLWAAKTEIDIAEGVAGGIPKKPFSELLDRYEAEVSRKKKGWRWERHRINLIKRDPVALVKLPDLRAPDFAAWRDRRLRSVSAATVRREWNLLNHAINIAINEWHWLKENPLKSLTKPKPPQSRDRLISDNEIALILHTTGFYNGMETKSARVGAAFLFAIETGMRAGEIAGLTKHSLHSGGAAVLLEQTKNGTSRYVPLSTRARELLEMVGYDFKLSSDQISSLFRKARDMAGIDNLHFHDTRHEAITRLAEKIEVLELARMVGIKDLSMLMVYYNKTADEIAKKLD